MEFRQTGILRMPLSGRTDISTSGKPKVDCVTECEWEVFVIRRDDKTGDFATQTACCEDAISAGN